MDPNTPQPLTLVDYYALAIAPHFYNYFLDKYSGASPDKIRESGPMMRDAIFEQASGLAAHSLRLRQSPPREGRSDEGTGDRVA
jgi:hypothetical protein